MGWIIQGDKYVLHTYTYLRIEACKTVGKGFFMMNVKFYIYQKGKKK